MEVKTALNHPQSNCYPWKILKVLLIVLVFIQESFPSILCLNGVSWAWEEIIYPDHVIKHICLTNN